MDLAVLYGGGQSVHGLTFQPLLSESLYLVGPCSLSAPADPVPLERVGDMDLFLPRPYNVVRKVVDAACAGIGLVPHVVAEIESASTLASVIAAGMGVTILPESMAKQVVASTSAWHARIIDPTIEVPLALCQSDNLPLSEPAVAIRQILLELVRELPGNSLPSEVISLGKRA
jgi:LysR family nitrogen assimilation transcriptional regulator